MASHRLSSVLLPGLCLLGLACGSPSDDGSVVAPAKVSLTVEAALEQSSVGSSSAANGKLFAVVQLTLVNGLSSAVVVSPSTFRLRSADGLEILASPNSAQLMGACPSDALLAAGRTLACVVAFEMNRSTEPEALLYVGAADGQVEPAVVRAEAPVASFERCTRCDDVCVDLKTNVEHCGGCGVIACDTCQDGVPSCSNGDTCMEQVCVDATVVAMLRTSTSAISCDTLCSREGKACEVLSSWDGGGLERPQFVYEFSGDEEVIVEAVCSAVPPAVAAGYEFKELRCACR